MKASAVTDEATSGTSLTAKTVRGAGWMVVWRVVTRSLGFVSTFILARLLLPADFGLVALAAAFANAIDAMAALGIQEVMLRERKPDADYYSTGFTLGLVRTVIAGLVIAAFAFPAGHFFGDARLSWILLILAPLLIIESSENVGTLDFRRQLRFERDFILFLIPRLAAVAVTIGLAVAFRTYWALVAGIAMQKCARTALSYALHPFRPRFTLVARHRLLRLSCWIWGTSIASLLRERSDSFIIGRMMNTAAVGLFSVAVEIALLPISEFVDPMGRALYAGLSAAYHGGMPTGRVLAKALAAMVCIVLPAGIGVSLVAAPLIRVTLGEAWLQAYPLVAIVAPFAAFSVVTNIGALGVMVIGNPKITTVTTAVMAVVRVPLLLAGIGMAGLAGLAWALAASFVLESAIYMAVLIRAVNFQPGDLARESWRSLAAAAGMFLLLFHTGIGWAPAPAAFSDALAALAAAGSIGAACYISLHALLWALAGFPDGPEALIVRFVRQHLPVFVASSRPT